jgi:pimeloyl-ACP methyl ester carboxylesterase
MLGKTPLAQRPEVVAKLDQQFQSPRPRGIYPCVKALGKQDNLLPQLPQVQIPTLVMVGEEDRAVSVERVRAVAEALPHAQLKVIPQAGHICVLEQPELINPAILSFLQSV